MAYSRRQGVVRDASMNAHDQPHAANGSAPTPWRGGEAAKKNTSSVDFKPAPHALALVASKDEPRIDSRVLAITLGVKHHSLFELVKNHRNDFVELGILRFQTEAISGRGQLEKFVLLSEDQAFFVLAMSRNNARVINLKLRLVKAFGEARRNAQLRQTEYLPEHHLLHDQVAELARGSANQHHIHANFSRLVNKVAGIEAGQRNRAPTATLAMVCMVAARAMAGATDHRDGYLLAKAALQELQGLLPLAQSIRSLNNSKVTE